MRRNLVFLITIASIGMTYITFGLSIMLIPAAYFGYKFGKLIAQLYPLVKHFINIKETLHFLFWYFLVAPTLYLSQYGLWWLGVIIGVTIMVATYYVLKNEN